MNSPKIENAKMIAEILHCNQKYDNEDYIFHLKNVYMVLIEFGFENEDLLCAAWLHDSVEDTQMKLSLIEKYFGHEVSSLVYAVTNEVGKNRKERNLKTYQKIQNNFRATSLKLADRIANVRQCITKNNTNLYEMYKKEYDIFRYTLKLDIGTTNDSLWKELDKLMEYTK